MKPTRRFMLFVSSLLLTLAVLSSMPTLAHAADAQGKLTLPTQTSWNGVMLPAGTYKYSVQYNGSATLVTLRNEETMESTLLMASTISDDVPMTKPSLVLTREGRSAFVTAFNLGDTTLTFVASTPKMGTEVARARMASGNGTGPAAPVK